MSCIKQFYDDIQFPGKYTMSGLDYHTPKIKNIYLQTINDAINENQTILDVGCGTGLISNLFAKRYPTSQFTGIDFANSINYAIDFATEHHINNVTFIKKDFLKFSGTDLYDVVICQGVLHHIPDHYSAIVKLKSLVKPGGKLVLGLYHPWGKILKKWYAIDYRNDILYRDQELNPYETSFNLKQVLAMCDGFKLKTASPAIINTHIAIPAFFNYRNGGLVTYTLENTR